MRQPPGCSWNRKLLNIALGNLRERGLDVAEFDLSLIPLYNEDVRERGYPDSVAGLRAKIGEADAVVVSCPEYNESMTSVIKVALEWASRPPGVITDNVFYIMGTSTGRSAAMRMRTHLASTLEGEGAWVVHHPEILLPGAEQVLTSDGRFQVEELYGLVDLAMTRTLEVAGKLRGLTPAYG